MNAILAKVFEFFKTRSPKIYAIFIAVVGVVWVLQGQGVLHLPQFVVDTLIALGLVSGTHTTAVLKNS